MLSGVLRVCSFESRRREEMAALIGRHRGDATVVPSMQEVPLDDQAAVVAFAEALHSGQVDMVIFMTGVGAHALAEVIDRTLLKVDFRAALRAVTIVVRGPKPAAVLRGWDVPVSIRAAEPNTWQQVVEAIDAAEVPVAGQRVFVQEYGQPTDALYAELRSRGAVVTPVPVYCWTLPDDTGPLERAIETAIGDGFDLLLFTSAQQVRHVLQVAARNGQELAWRHAAQRCVIASIGPTCSEALRDVGLPVDLEPSHPRMGTLVREALAAAPELLARKPAL